MFLLDTNVVSETRKPRPNPGVISWLKDADAGSLHLSVLSVGEIRKGIERLRRRDATGAQEIEMWLNSLELAFADRLLDVNLEVADRWGTLAADSDVDSVDVFLAATASVWNLTLVTRNTKHVNGFDVPVLNPFSA